MKMFWDENLCLDQILWLSSSDKIHPVLNSFVNCGLKHRLLLYFGGWLGGVWGGWGFYNVYIFSLTFLLWVPFSCFLTAFCIVLSRIWRIQLVHASPARTFTSGIPRGAVTRGASHRWDWAETPHRWDWEGVSQVGLGRRVSQVGLAMLRSWRPLCSSSAPTQPEVSHLQENRSYFNRCARNRQVINNQNTPHLSADCVEMVATSVEALVHDFQSVHLCMMVNYHQV